MAKDILNLDFSKEEEVGGRIRWPEGDYHVEIMKIKKVRSSQKDTPGIAVTFRVLEGKRKGKKITENLWITPKSLGRIRLLLEAVGVKVPKKAINIPLKKLLKKRLWIEIVDDEQEGYDTKSTVAFQGFMSEEDYEADPEDDDDLDDDDEDEDEDDDEDDDDDDEDDEDEDDDDDEEDEPAPKKRKKKAAAKKKPVKKSKKKKSKKDDDDEDIEDLDLDDL